MDQEEEIAAIDSRREPHRLMNYLLLPVIHHPLHKHSFHHKAGARTIFSCISCHQSIWGPFSHGCRCLRCGKYVHRQCAGNDSLEQCTIEIGPPPKRKSSLKISKRTRAKEYVLKYAPYVAGGVLGGVFAGPVGAMAGAGFGFATTKKTKSQVDWASEICREFSAERQSEVTTQLEEQFLASFDPEKPDKTLVRTFLYAVLANGHQHVSKINVAMNMKYRERCQKRSPPPSTGRRNSLEQRLLDETVNDTKSYIGHLIAVALYAYPILQATDQTVLICTTALEEILCADIYDVVYREFQLQFAVQDRVFDEKVHSLWKFNQRSTYSSLEGFQTALQKVKDMTEQRVSPMAKVSLLGESFVALCAALEQVNQRLPSADDLLPVICQLLIEARPSELVANLAFITAMTGGGGQGMEGYTLTTYQAALHVIANTDTEISNSEDEEQFYDAREPGPDFELFNRRTLRDGLVQVYGTEDPYPYPLKEELDRIEQVKKEFGF